jgi:hypothetical protein
MYKAFVSSHASQMGDSHFFASNRSKIAVNLPPPIPASLLLGLTHYMDTMKDSCGICSSFLEGGEVMKDSGSKRTTFGDYDDTIMQVESIVNSPSKLDSIAETKEEAEADEAEEKKEEERELANDETSAEEVEPKVVAHAVTSPKSAAVATTGNPVKEITVIKTENTTLERDFDKNPTDLYLSLMRKDWSAAIRRCAERPEEAKTWIYRREATGNLRWKLLPIHASIIFTAPVPVIDALLHANAAGAACKDDQGMVPLHLAIRMNSDQAVVEKLVAAQPNTVTATDRKGRTPRALAEKQAATPKTLLVIQTLENAGSVGSPNKGMTHSAQAIAKAAAAASARTAATAKGKAVAVASPKAAVEAKKAMSSAKAFPKTPAEIEQLMQHHTQEIEKLHREAAVKQIQLTARIEVLEKAAEIDKSAISSLEESLKTAEENESELQSKIGEMESTFAETMKEKNAFEDANKAVITNLVSQVGDLQNKLTAMTAARDESVKSMADYEESCKQEMAKQKLKGFELERQLGQVTFIKEEKEEALAKAEKLILQQKGRIVDLQDDNTTLRQTLRTTEAKLEEVTISEQELAWQNADLNVKLTGGVVVAGPAAAIGSGNDDTSDRVKALEQEREELRETVNRLSVKLYKVVGFLDEMVQEQEAIIAETMTRDSEMLPMGDGGSQEESATMPEDRQKLLSNVAGMKEQIIGVIDSVIDGMPPAVDEDLVDDDDHHQAGSTLKADTTSPAAAVLQ